MCEVQRVVLDADFGTDDAVALLLLLFAETLGLIKLEAIICSFGNTGVENCVRNVGRLLDAAQRNDVSYFVYYTLLLILFIYF